MSRIPQPLAGRVDRLARRAHAFHRWSHHPLCERYRTEVVRLGRRTRICLGCSLTALGAVAGLAAGALLPAAPGAAIVAAGAALLLLAPALVRPHPRTAPAPSAGAAWRRRKLLTRLLPTAVAGLAVAQALAAPAPARAVGAALAALAVFWVTLRYRRRGPDRAVCLGCPEGPPSARCPGFAPMARRERAFSRLAGRWIAAALPPPGAPATAPAPAPLPPPEPAPAPPASGRLPWPPRPAGGS